VRRVPSRLLDTLENGQTQIALCPVIDYQLSSRDLAIVPCGAIGCDGPALTVQLFSRNPIPEITDVAVDGESHTSAALLQVVLDGLYGIRPAVNALPSGQEIVYDAVLLIGDKVITRRSDLSSYEHHMDLGQAWRELTGKPFVFATWMTPVDTELRDVPRRLDRLRRLNATRLAEIARVHAKTSGWPTDLAIQYLSRNLRYEIGPPELDAVQSFWCRCLELNLIDRIRPLAIHPAGDAAID
jgi:chorismate dehydratase